MMPTTAHDDRIAWLLLEVHRELDRRNGNLKTSAPRYLQAPETVATGWSIVKSYADGKPADPAASLDWVGGALDVFRRWIESNGGHAPDGLGVSLKRWTASAAALRAETALLAASSPV